jgi:2-dehydropantoate 2-reductase
MKILMYGAGVIGSLYAAKLKEGGHHVTVLARGDRLTEIGRHGLVLEDIVSGARTISRVETIERIAPDDQYDVAMVTVRRDQLASIVPECRRVGAYPPWSLC